MVCFFLLSVLIFLSPGSWKSSSSLLSLNSAMRLSFSLSEIDWRGHMRLLLYSPFWSHKSSYDENLASRSLPDCINFILQHKFDTIVQWSLPFSQLICSFPYICRPAPLLMSLTIFLLSSSTT
ncbi:hypothetical protein HOLleu_37495 [Holothuria leucospilota]|uniref:Uncharacterized protein n=1 Tax=Holothuria leucospilota TaxID=206669 RepID=A0A9Q0YH86_HOLLE|nr:hypothetical protein HOLleu_37495 [Holothuria leucospilota]